VTCCRLRHYKKQPGRFNDDLAIHNHGTARDLARGSSR
jgi:hypothetical protein